MCCAVPAAEAPSDAQLCPNQSAAVMDVAAKSLKDAVRAVGCSGEVNRAVKHSLKQLQYRTSGAATRFPAEQSALRQARHHAFKFSGV